MLWLRARSQPLHIVKLLDAQSTLHQTVPSRTDILAVPSDMSLGYEVRSVSNANTEYSSSLNTLRAPLSVGDLAEVSPPMKLGKSTSDSAARRHFQPSWERVDGEPKAENLSSVNQRIRPTSVALAQVL